MGKTQQTRANIARCPLSAANYAQHAVLQMWLIILSKSLRQTKKKFAGSHMHSVQSVTYGTQTIRV